MDLRRGRVTKFYIHKVNMRKCDGGWDAHVNVKSEEPELDLGTFVVLGVGNPQELEERLQPALDEFVGSLDGETFEVQH